MGAARLAAFRKEGYAMTIKKNYVVRKFSSDLLRYLLQGSALLLFSGLRSERETGVSLMDSSFRCSVKLELSVE